MHKSDGVCVVEDIRAGLFSQTPSREYYILRPLFENSNTTVFLPIDVAEKRLRPLFNKTQLEALLHNVTTQSMTWERNDRMRQEQFSQLVKEGEPSVLLSLLKVLYEQRKEQQAVGKKLRFFDEHTLQDCERFLSQEFAHIWETDIDSALSKIKKEL